MERKTKKEGELTVTVIGEARRLQMFCFMACGADRKRPGEISPPGRAWHRYAGCKGERVGEGRKGGTHMQKRAFSTHYIATLRRCVRIRTHSRGPLPSDKICSRSPSSKIFAKQCEGEGGNCGENCRGRSAENCYRGREGEFPSSIRNQVPVKPYFVTLENHFHENAILPESVQLSQSKQVPYLGHEDD